ncbi:MAG: Bug family tripartite tricarboxylate transporter substrate binding protein, partial [Comamonas testosteroni]|uniref:Bug family tripartite tricarboxylate transporter substrate binding protein n=1 Tax=Comamonas testosteroni TaxID=285 RepID=UPI003D1116A3
MKTIASVAVLLAAAGQALAQGDASGYPNRPVTVVTAFAVGSGPDAVLRIVGEKLAQRWKQGVTVDNRPGGGGFVAIEYARRAKPDGYTLLQLDSEHISALPYLYKNKNFNTLSHFDPVAPLFLTPFFVAVPTTSPWKNMSDLIKSAKAEPGKLSYGSWGVGSP